MTQPALSDDHIDAAGSRLVDLTALSHRTQEAERRILARATERMGDIQADLAKLAPRVVADADAARRYEALLVERGQLALIIARAQETSA